MEALVLTCLDLRSSRQLVVERKVELLVHEFKMNMVGISETKWCGQAVCLVDGCTVVHSGRPVPMAGDVVRVLVLFSIQ